MQQLWGNIRWVHSPSVAKTHRYINADSLEIVFVYSLNPELVFLVLLLQHRSETTITIHCKAQHQIHSIDFSSEGGRHGHNLSMRNSSWFWPAKKLSIEAGQSNLSSTSVKVTWEFVLYLGLFSISAKVTVRICSIRCFVGRIALAMVSYPTFKLFFQTADITLPNL